MYRDPNYLAWLRTKPCMACGRKPSTAAHIGTSNMGFKPPDNQCVPLCMHCHQLQEYHKGDFKKTAHHKTKAATFESITKRPLPTLKDAEFYFTAYLQENRLPNPLENPSE